MRLPRLRDPAELLWQGEGPPPASRPFPRLVLAVAIGAFAALYPAVLPARLLLAFLSGLFAGTALPGLARRCSKCGSLLLPLGGRYCGRCGVPRDRVR